MVAGEGRFRSQRFGQLEARDRPEGHSQREDRAEAVMTLPLHRAQELV
jgi:hypothetical protein